MHFLQFSEQNQKSQKTIIVIVLKRLFQNQTEYFLE